MNQLLISRVKKKEIVRVANIILPLLESIKL